MPEVYARTLTLRPREPRHASRSVFLDSLREWLGDRWPGTRDWLAFEKPATFEDPEEGIFRWQPFEGPDGTIGDFSWRHADEQDAALSWSTRVTFLESARGTRAVIRVRNTGPSPGEAGARLTVRPRLVLGLHERFHCVIDGVPSRRRVQYLSGDDFPHFVRYILLDPDRKDPVLLITPLEPGDYVEAPSRLLDEFLTLGSLYAVREPDDTYALTGELKRREMSCFYGALRAYMSGFRLDDDPFAHPLLLARRAGVPALRKRLAQILAVKTVSRHEEDTEIAPLRDQRAVAYERGRNRTLAELRSQAATARKSGDWEEIANSYAEENDTLRADVESLEESVREAGERVFLLEQQVRRLRRGEPEPAGEPLEQLQPDSVLDAVEMAESMFASDLVFLLDAHASAGSSPYGRPQDILDAFRVMAEIARAKRAGPLGKRLADAFKERGIDYRGGLSKTTSKKLRKQYVFSDDDRSYVCEEHICFGGSTYDPAECARIYFLTDTDDGLFVVGHVGKHLKVMTTT